MIIYLITNTVNGKKYVGQHCGTDDSRWKQHMAASLKLENPIPLYRAMRKYGLDKFTYEVLEEIPLNKGPKYLNEREIHWIKEIKSFINENGYNVTRGGQGVVSYYCSSERSKKLSNSLDKLNYGQYDPYTGKLIKVWDKAKDPERELNVVRTHMKYASDWHKGEGKWGKTAGGFMWYILPNGEVFPEYITPLQGKTKNYGQDRTHRRKYDETKEISQYYLSGVLVEVWNNDIEEISTKTGIPRPSIRKALTGKIRVAGGYQWRVFEKGKSPDIIDSELIPNQIKLSKRQLQNIPIFKFLDEREISRYNNILDAMLDSDVKPSEILSSIELGKEDSKGFNWKWEYNVNRTNGTNTNTTENPTDE
jgi:group I intron endonuclease